MTRGIIEPIGLEFEEVVKKVVKKRPSGETEKHDKLKKEQVRKSASPQVRKSASPQVRKSASPIRRDSSG